jgi:hypothetical protein
MAKPIPLFAPVTSAVFVLFTPAMLREPHARRPRPSRCAVIPAGYQAVAC